MGEGRGAASEDCSVKASDALSGSCCSREGSDITPESVQGISGSTVSKGPCSVKARGVLSGSCSDAGSPGITPGSLLVDAVNTLGTASSASSVEASGIFSGHCSSKGGSWATPEVRQRK